MMGLNVAIILFSVVFAIVTGIISYLIKSVVVKYKSNKLEITIENESGKSITLEITDDMEQEQIEEIILEALAI